MAAKGNQWGQRKLCFSFSFPSPLLLALAAGLLFSLYTAPSFSLFFPLTALVTWNIGAMGGKRLEISFKD